VKGSSEGRYTKHSSDRVDTGTRGALMRGQRRMERRLYHEMTYLGGNVTGRGG